MIILLIFDKKLLLDIPPGIAYTHLTAICTERGSSVHCKLSLARIMP